MFFLTLTHCDSTARREHRPTPKQGSKALGSANIFIHSGVKLHKLSKPCFPFRLPISSLQTNLVLHHLKVKLTGPFCDDVQRSSHGLAWRHGDNGNDGPSADFTFIQCVTIGPIFLRTTLLRFNRASFKAQVRSTASIATDLAEFWVHSLDA
jgi:hypothetical protein